MYSSQNHISKLIEKAKKDYKKVQTGTVMENTRPVKWPVDCTVGPGLEGAIACESKVGYVNGQAGYLIYRGYDIFDLCAHSSFEDTSYLLLHGHLPNKKQLCHFSNTLKKYRHIPNTLRILMGFQVEKMNPMAALRLGTNLMRHELTHADFDERRPSITNAIGSDEDSIPMETTPRGEAHAIYEFNKKKRAEANIDPEVAGFTACNHLISGVATVTAAIARIRAGHLPIEPDPELSHTANFIYMLTGNRPTPLEERIMDIALILHADHGMNASTFAAMVVASTLSDIYFSVGSGIAALNGPLHGGANAQVVYMLEKIHKQGDVKAWFKRAVAKKKKIMGFGHRVYKTYDPRALILGPLAHDLGKKSESIATLYKTAAELESLVVNSLGKEKGIYPNVDYFSGLVYRALGIPTDMFPCIFAVSRVSGWTARIMEYLRNNRIFRPRAWYTGGLDNEYVPLQKRK